MRVQEEVALREQMLEQPRCGSPLRLADEVNRMLSVPLPVKRFLLFRFMRESFGMPVFACVLRSIVNVAAFELIEQFASAIVVGGERTDRGKQRARAAIQLQSGKAPDRETDA